MGQQAGDSLGIRSVGSIQVPGEDGDKQPADPRLSCLETELSQKTPDASGAQTSPGPQTTVPGNLPTAAAREEAPVQKPAEASKADTRVSTLSMNFLDEPEWTETKPAAAPVVDATDGDVAVCAQTGYAVQAPNNKNTHARGSIQPEIERFDQEGGQPAATQTVADGGPPSSKPKVTDGDSSSED